MVTLAVPLPVTPAPAITVSVPPSESREVLGEHVQQKGSLVDADKTRFDFAHKDTQTAIEIEGGTWSGGQTVTMRRFPRQPLFTTFVSPAVLTQDNDAIAVDGRSASVRLLAGTLGETYTVTHHIVTAGETPVQEDERSILIKIVEK